MLGLLPVMNMLLISKAQLKPPLSCWFRFYADEATWSVDQQFLWGPGLLITPVLDPVGFPFLT